MGLDKVEDRTLRPAFSAMETVSSTIFGAIGRRPVQEGIPKSPVNSNLESFSSTAVRKEDLSVFF